VGLASSIFQVPPSEKTQGALGTLVERTTRTDLLIPLVEKDANCVRKAFARSVKQLTEKMRLSMTYDRGDEMARKVLDRQTPKEVFNQRL